jgi:hypothetical protein
MFNIVSHQGNANQMTLRFHLTPVRTAKIKKKKKKKKKNPTVAGYTRFKRGCGEL